MITNILVTSYQLPAIKLQIPQIIELIFSWLQHPSQKCSIRMLHPSPQLQACTQGGIFWQIVLMRIVVVSLGNWDTANCRQCRVSNSDGWQVFYGWRALRQPCRASRQPCFMVDGAFGQMVDGVMFNFKFWISWPSIWYDFEIFRTNFSICVYLA